MQPAFRLPGSEQVRAAQSQRGRVESTGCARELRSIGRSRLRSFAASVYLAGLRTAALALTFALTLNLAFALVFVVALALALALA